MGRKLWPGLNGSEPVPAWSDTWERLFCLPFEVAWLMAQLARRIVWALKGPPRRKAWLR